MCEIATNCRRVEKPWGYEIWWAHTEHYAGKILHVDAGQKLSGHVWRNTPGTVHTVQAIEDTDVLEVSTPQLDDVVRLVDNYGREGTSAP